MNGKLLFMFFSIHWHLIQKKDQKFQTSCTRNMTTNLWLSCFFNFAESFCAFAECLRAALVKGYIMPRAYFWALGKGAVNPSWRLFFADGCHGARQKLCRVPDKRLSAKRPLPRKFLPIPLCWEQLSAKASPRALGKASVSGSVCTWYSYEHRFLG